MAAGLLAGFLLIITHQDAPRSVSRPAPAVWAAEPIQPLVEAPALDPGKVALGKKLFEDVRLSGARKLSCATCHDMASNGSLAGKRMTTMDTLTVFNSGLSSRLGWDGTEPNLQQQARMTLESPMMAQGVSLRRTIGRLANDETISRDFQAIYGGPVDAEGVIDAIVYYERSLVTPGSRFDQWLTGNATAINDREKRGYALFKQLGCVSCHQGRNVGGNLLQKHGVFRPFGSPDPKILRVPSLRNVATTAPYFHDGSAPTLEDAVAKMAASQLNVDLQKREITDLVAFLESLTGNFGGKPVSARR
ncbi:cytochrome-c peroxidase [Sphingomonas arantia]|uniref:Cytochrome-c peroxidase n=1 Tax=Sphingomonas arantia TaxID=1460676 RepID=A0ABW4U0C4_9SPHN